MNDWPPSFSQAVETFYANKAQMIPGHLDEYVTIYGDLILGFYSDETLALASMKNYKLGTFLVNKIVDPEVIELQYLQSIC